ncbi:DNA ligase [Ferrimonas balearica]|uniref:DNA ligase n=1 Tax=Ferrimonas balearica TaxID=44012 RepID=UPI001C98F8B4|nr:DNA ligase [Ferrimonas balearica]MBY5922977.1 DNA ligase [Ferrimonas balearica]MBY5997646.1 DNA ligase [Ferrimonas balearica]
MTSTISLSRVAAFCCCFPHTLYANGPDLMLAQPYQAVPSLSPYLVSEKYDGMRAYWDGTGLLSRGGRPIVAPAWFTRGWPSHPLDGELWLGRGQFQSLMRIVRDQIPDEPAWRQVQYRVFDRPDLLHPFALRYQAMRLTIESLALPHLVAVRQFRVRDHQQLAERLAEVVDAGGEGLILRHQDGRYRAGRDPGMLKLKPRWDGEARVVGYLPGNGRLQGMMGALIVEDPEGRRFRLGSGFSDEERRQPPPIGSVVTYSYNGRTDAGLPRFARFERRFLGL